MSALTEQEIIEGCRSQDRRVQAYLYKTRYSDYLKICMRYAAVQQDAEQLLNDSFYKIFTRIDQYDHAGSFEGWMKRIVINTCLDGLKTAMAKERARNVALDATQIEQVTPAAIADALQQISFRELVALIQELPETHRAVFNLYVFEGYSHKEIAAALQIKEGTSYWYINQAREWLKRKLSLQYVKAESYGKQGF